MIYKLTLILKIAAGAFGIFLMCISYKEKQSNNMQEAIYWMIVSAIMALISLSI